MIRTTRPGRAHVPARDARFARMDAALETQARALALPGVSAALIERGALVWTGARGWANIDKVILGARGETYPGDPETYVLPRLRQA